MIIDKGRGFSPFKGTAEAKESHLNRSTREYFSKTVDFGKLVTKKAAPANLKLYRKKVLELSLVVTLVMLVVSVQIARQFGFTAEPVDKVEVKIEVADIPPTEQTRRPPPPPRPSIPIPTEAESVPEDVTIASTDIDLSEIPPPPAPPEENEFPVFVAYDEPPRIIGGMAALQRQLEYPRIARQSGVEGIVFVKVLVGADGETEKTEILQARPPDMGFEESAKDALQKVKWQPARQRDRNIRVWVTIPVQFQLVS